MGLLGVGEYLKGKTTADVWHYRLRLDMHWGLVGSGSLAPCRSIPILIKGGDLLLRIVFTVQAFCKFQLNRHQGFGFIKVTAFLYIHRKAYNGTNILLRYHDNQW